MPRVDLPPPVFDRPSPIETNRKAAVAEGLTDFTQVLLGGATALASQIVPTVASVAGMGNGPLGVGGGISSLLGGGGLGGGAMNYQQLLMLQMKMQQESQVFQAQSNISKTEHDAKMNAVRNIRP